MEEIRQVALGLREQGWIEILQKGKPVVGPIKGPIRLRILGASGRLDGPQLRKGERDCA